MARTFVNASSQYITFPAISSLGTTFTVACWFRTPTINPSEQRMLMSSSTTTADQWEFLFTLDVDSKLHSRK
jgi:hypothetical protein